MAASSGVRYAYFLKVAKKVRAFVSLGRDEIDLREKGIYFRAAHLGNVILTPDVTLGPIDISDVKTFHRPLRKRLRLRNFKHMLRYEQDRQWLIGNNNRLPSTAIRKTCLGKAIIAQTSYWWTWPNPKGCSSKYR
ncbi:toluene tolerance protein [Pseudomonas syringae]|nr:toluene tolerance protein [Pseudomonas syringae]